MKQSAILRTFFLAAPAARYVASAEDDDNAQCGLYLATSTLSTLDETRWGVFAGKEIPTFSAVGYPDIGIHLPQLRSHVFSDNLNDQDNIQFLDAMVSFYESFFWVPETIAAQSEFSEPDGVAPVPGTGTLAATYVKMINANWNVSSAFFRPLQGEKTSDPHPNRGAISPFYNVQLMATDDIIKGGEIFIEIGEVDDEEDDEDGGTLVGNDLAKVDETVKLLLEYFEKHDKDLKAETKDKLYQFFLKDILRISIHASKLRKVMKIFPSSLDGLKDMVEAGGASSFSSTVGFRSIAELEKTGLCMDNIRPGESTIPQAGRGAFAARPIKKGGLVAPVPLLPIPDKEILNMHKLKKSRGTFVKASDDVVGQQLLLNYCYGHPKSTMVFLPIGAVVALINHSDKPNAKLVWSKHPNHKKDWMNIDPEDLMDEELRYAGLMMEVVAIKDIKPNEEIFIDYGSEWKAAWKTHLNKWNALVKDGTVPKVWPTKAIDMNDKFKVLPYKTEDELKKQPYPENVELHAFIMISDEEGSGTSDDPAVWQAEGLEAFQTDYLFPVEVVERKKLEDSEEAMPYRYTIRTPVDKKSYNYIAEVPHSVLVFLDKPGTSDQFVENGFRHPIGIPDDIFPQGEWRNVK